MAVHQQQLSGLLLSAATALRVVIKSPAAAPSRSALHASETHRELFCQGCVPFVLRDEPVVRSLHDLLKVIQELQLLPVQDIVCDCICMPASRQGPAGGSG